MSLSDHLRRAWSLTWRDLWSPLIDHASAHPDLPIELLRTLADKKVLGRAGEERYVGVYLTNDALGRMDLGLDLNSADKARRVFKVVNSADFESNAAVARYLEAAASVIDEFEEPSLSSRYLRLLRRFLDRRNLPYSLQQQPLVLRPRLQCALEHTYSVLEQAAGTDGHLAEAFDAFVRAWGRFADANDPDDLRSTIEKASKLAEAYVGVQLGQADTLGALVQALRRNGTFPHVALAQAIERVYGFCSDYPHIRHAGNPAGRLRDLQPRDAALVSLVLIAFAGYARDA